MQIIGKTKELIGEIDGFWDTIAKASMVFRVGIKDYLQDRPEKIVSRITEINELEHLADRLRKQIKVKLYAQMLIPESRGDVLGLLESSDNVIDSAKKVLNSFDIEKPLIPDFLTEDFINLVDASADAVEEMVKAARAFFKEVSVVNDYINKVSFFEHEADKLEDTIKRKAFDSIEIESLSWKVQVRYFAERVAKLSDGAEEVCERLSISVIKRSL